MRKDRLNRISSAALLVLSLTASVVPWLLEWRRGFDQPPLADEGTPAHLFQLSIVLLMPVALIFLSTADLRRPWQIVRRSAIPAALVFLSVAGLFYYEHIYIPTHF